VCQFAVRRRRDLPEPACSGRPAQDVLARVPPVDFGEAKLADVGAVPV
jgi:hypothetical protein